MDPLVWTMLVSAVSFIAGAGAVYAHHAGYRRNTRRLRSIVELARHQDSLWASGRRASASDWTDLIAEISPYEEV